MKGNDVHDSYLGEMGRNSEIQEWNWVADVVWISNGRGKPPLCLGAVGSEWSGVLLIERGWQRHQEVEGRRIGLERCQYRTFSDSTLIEPTDRLCLPLILRICPFILQNQTRASSNKSRIRLRLLPSNTACPLQLLSIPYFQRLHDQLASLIVQYRAIVGKLGEELCTIVPALECSAGSLLVELVVERLHNVRPLHFPIISHVDDEMYLFMRVGLIRASCCRR